MRIREFFKRAAIGVFNRVCSDQDNRNMLICQSTVIGIATAGFASGFPLMEIIGDPFVSAAAATALTYGALRPANRWMEWACAQPMP